MKLSIITINYNNASGLKRTLESIVAQTNRHFEYIVIDGGSTDGSKEHLEHYKDKIDYFISEKDNGIYDAMNKGIKVAKGEYLQFLNSGDHLFEKKTIEKVSAHLNSITDIIYGNMKIDDRGKLTDGFMPDKLTLTHMLNDTLWHPVSFIKKELFIKYGLYSTDYKICGDYDFFFKVLIREKVNTKHINQFIVVFDLDGMSSDVKNVSLIKSEKSEIQKKYISEDEIIANKHPGKKQQQEGFFKRWFR